MINVDSDFLNENYQVKGPIQDYELNMYMDKDQVCRYSTINESYSNMTRQMPCSGAKPSMSHLGHYKCSATLNFNETTFIRCKKEVDRRNVNTKSYALFLER